MTDLCTVAQYQAGHRHDCGRTLHGPAVQHKCVCGYLWTHGNHATTCPKLMRGDVCECGAET